MPLDAHGCPACPHPAVGPAIQGSPDVNVNRRPALRVDDPGIHMACCGTNTWSATTGSLTVLINGKGAHRIGDQNRHCGGVGQLVEGSPNVIVGESTGGSGGASGGDAGTGGGTAGAAGGTRDGGGSRDSGSGRGTSGANTNGNAGPGTDHRGGSPGSGPSGEPAIEPDEIEVRVVDASGKPIDRVIVYELIMPDGTTRAGQTDARGTLKLTALTQRGTCKFVVREIDNRSKRN